MSHDFLISCEPFRKMLTLLDSLLAIASSTWCSLKSVCSSYVAWSLPPWVNQIWPWWPSWEVVEWSAVSGLSQHHTNHLWLPTAWDLWPVSLFMWCPDQKMELLGEGGSFSSINSEVLQLTWEPQQLIFGQVCEDLLLLPHKADGLL